ncbi:MAG TPA: ATP-binding protein, partial [Woeseiaceae bacterium]|nr:ATP-binding protein [Woeseiaceae bacterium]
ESVFWGGESSELIAFLATTSEELAALAPEERRQRVAELRRQPVLFASGNPPPPRRPPQFDAAAAARTYEQRLERELGRAYGVSVRPARQELRNAIRIRGGRLQLRDVAGPEGRGRGGGPEPDLDVAIRLPDGGLLAFRVPAPRSGPPLPRGIFLQLGVLTAVLALVLFLMARGITRPLSALAGAAEAVSRGGSPQQLPETGAREIRDATRAFNTMQERLQRYLESRTQMLAAMSHDLRTPLTRMLLRAERIKDPDLRDRFVQDANEMTAMIQATLELFRGMNGEEPTSRIEVMPFLAVIAGEFAETGADVTLAGAANAPIEARPVALKRCMTNLIGNAVKYGKRAHVVVEDGDALVIRVRDDGPGIPPGALGKVFEPFYRLEQSRNPATGGTGLGLSIARDIAQLHGGTVELLNLEPRGLEAVLTLPRRTG